MDFSGKTGPELVQMYNEMYQTWTDLGGDNTFGTVRRFASAEVGRARCERLHAAILARRSQPGPVQPSALSVAAELAPTEETDDMAKRRANGARRQHQRAKSREGGRPTIKELTAEFNSLVPAAKRAGATWAKVHTSNFGSLVAAQTQLARLKKAVAAGK